MAAIPGGVKITGFISPTDSDDTYPVTDPRYGIGGYREVADHAERDAISDERRRAGMLVYTANDGLVWQMASDLTSWTEFTTGGGGPGPQNKRFEIVLTMTVGVFAGEVVTVYVTSMPFLMSANLTGSQGVCYASDPQSFDLSIERGGVVLGHVRISDNVVTFDWPDDIIFDIGDVMTIRAIQPALFETMTFSIQADRTN
jgi:hypothetical protein